jgi:hypothetical protein
MPKKLKRGKAFQHKKKRVNQPAVPVSVESPVTAAAQTPTARVVSTAVKTRIPAVKYPYVTAELRRIGIIAGAILAILIVLAIVL